MPAMTKRVNIKANVPVRNINPPIYGTCKNMAMTTGDILKCLCARAIVDEILPDGSTIRLSMKNYQADNVAEFNKKNTVAEEAKIDTVFDTDEAENVVETTNADKDNESDENTDADSVEVDPAIEEGAEVESDSPTDTITEDATVSEDLGEATTKNDSAIYIGPVFVKEDSDGEDHAETVDTVAAATTTASTTNTAKKKSSNNKKKK